MWKSILFLNFQVVALARREDRLADLASKLESKPGKLHLFKADVTVEDDILRAVKWAEETLGPIHILINNAGISRRATLLDGSTEDFRAVLETNVLGLTIATREAAKSMRANKIDGHIVHINSVLGHKASPVPYTNVYPASKYAVTALTESLRNELVWAGSRIKVTVRK